MQSIARYILISVVLFLFPCLLSAQSVGLVLSGGGAKGLVHIGVIKALEEQQIPIDYVAGTSIGAIIGSMYACGYSVEEITHLFVSSEFASWSSGDYSGEAPSYYKRLIDDAELGSIKIHLGSHTSLALPTNIVPPYQMDFALLGIYAGATAAANGDLDHLMLPLRVVSTNIANKAQYAPRYGDVGTLVRASMSFPGLYKPAMVDSMLLFDGGLVNNFPISVMQSGFAPDFIVGSDCSFGTGSMPNEDDVISQIFALAMAAPRSNVPSFNGAHILVDSATVDLLEWESIMPLIDMGYRYAMRQMPQILEQIKRRRSKQELDSMRTNFNAKKPPLLFKNVRVSGGGNRLRQYVRSRLTRRGDTLVPMPTMRYRYFEAISDEGLTTCVPQPMYNAADSAFDLNLRISAAPNFKAAIGGYYSTAVLQSLLSMSYTYYAPLTMRFYANLYAGTIYLSHNAIVRGDFRLSPWRLPFFAELGETYSNSDYYSKNPDLAFFDTRPDFLKDNEYYGYLNVGAGIPLTGAAMRLGAAMGNRQAHYYPKADFTSADIPERMKFQFVMLKFCIENNTLNFKTNATRGVRFLMEGSFIYGVEHHTYGTQSDRYVKENPVVLTETIGMHSIWRAVALRTQHFELSKYFSLGYHIEGAYSSFIYLKDYYANLLMLPAFEPLHHTNGLFLENFRSSIYAAAGVIPTYVAAFISPKVLLRSELYVYLPFAQLNSDNIYQLTRPVYNANVRNIYFMGSVSAIWHSPVGALTFSVSYYDRSRPTLSNFYFSAGLGYYLKNKRAW